MRSPSEADVAVPCGGSSHVIRLTDDGLEFLGHGGERGDDDVLVALGGAPAKCRAIEEAWCNLDDGRAIDLLDASREQLETVARRLPATLDQRERVRRRDDLTDGQRARALAGFDQMAYLAEVAALGPVLSRRRAVDGAEAVWRTASRRRAARAGVGALVARSLGTRASAVLLAPRFFGGFVFKVGDRALGVVSLRLLLRVTSR